MQLRDRPEFSSKPKPLAFEETAMTAEAVAGMSRLNYGSAVVVDKAGTVTGIVTERDILRRIVDAGKDAAKTPLAEIMTAQPRVAKETDDVLDWLRIMSNDRFRRLPVVDDEGRIKAVFTQGDFVSYTWPDLIFQAKELTKATVSRSYHLWLIGGGIALYSLLMVWVLGAL
jgi:CBS domain-containing protein